MPADMGGVPIVTTKDNFITGFEPMSGAGGIGQQVSQWKQHVLYTRKHKNKTDFLGEGLHMGWQLPE